MGQLGVLKQLGEGEGRLSGGGSEGALEKEPQPIHCPTAHPTAPRGLFMIVCRVIHSLIYFRSTDVVNDKPLNSTSIVWASWRMSPKCRRKKSRMRVASSEQFCSESH